MRKTRKKARQNYVDKEIEIIEIFVNNFLDSKTAEALVTNAFLKAVDLNPSKNLENKIYLKHLKLLIDRFNMKREREELWAFQILKAFFRLIFVTIFK